MGVMLICFASACAKCRAVKAPCQPRVEESSRGQSCKRCYRKHLGCSWNGEKVEPEEEDDVGGLDKEDILKAIRTTLRAELIPELVKVRSGMRCMSTEFWNGVKGVTGRGRDELWTEQAEAFQNWEQWGVAGTGYSHLAPLDPARLRRIESESEESGDEEELDEGELEALSEYDRRWGQKERMRNKGKGKAKEMDVDGEEEEDEDEEDEEDGEGDPMEE